MDGTVHIGEAARRLGVSPEHLRALERRNRIPKPARDFNGRVYSEDDLALLRSLGIGKRPARLRALDEALAER